MPLLEESSVRRRATLQTTLLQKSARGLLTETASASSMFDVFLSHSSAEPDQLLLGVKLTLMDHGLSVYIDRYTDPELSPDQVTPGTAAKIRQRIEQSRSLLYLYSQHSTISRWMPWELGYFDGSKGKVGILPVTQGEKLRFSGEEYLGLYPYLDETVGRLWINSQTPGYFADFKGWIAGTDAIIKH